MKTSICYLIHFNKQFKHARHYLGSTSNLEARIKTHRQGRGARLMEVIVAAGITWRVVRTWPGDRQRERQLKNRGGHARLCPTCQGATYV